MGHYFQAHQQANSLSACQHPALMLPTATQAVADTYERLAVQRLAFVTPKTDTPSLAGYVRHAYQWGWLNGDDLNLLSSANPALALYHLANKAAAYFPKRLDIAEAINPQQTIKNLGCTPLTAVSVQAMAHAGIKSGVVDADSLLSAFRDMTHAEAQFPMWFDDALNQYVIDQTAKNLDVPAHTLKDALHVEFDFESSDDGATVRIANRHGLALYGLCMPMGDSGNSVMLRDALRLLSDSLAALDVYHTAPEYLYSGGCFFEEDIDAMFKKLGEGANADAVLGHLRGVVIEALIEEGFDAELVNEMSLDDLLENEDYEIGFETLREDYPSLYGGCSYGDVSVSYREYAAHVSELMNPSHWSLTTALPTHLHLPASETDGERQARWQAIAAHFQDTIAAVALNLGELIPDTVAALQSLARWLTLRAEAGIPNTYLEDQDADQEAVPFEQTFLVAACGSDNGECSPMELRCIGAIDEDAMNVGSGGRSCFISKHEPIDTFKKIVEIAATYNTFAQAMTTLEVARDAEKINIQ